MHLVLCSK